MYVVVEELFVILGDNHFVFTLQFLVGQPLKFDKTNYSVRSRIRLIVHTLLVNMKPAWFGRFDELRLACYRDFILSYFFIYLFFTRSVSLLTPTASYFSH